MSDWLIYNSAIIEINTLITTNEIIKLKNLIEKYIDIELQCEMRMFLRTQWDIKIFLLKLFEMINNNHNIFS
jgi:hypothetical protein